MACQVGREDDKRLIQPRIFHTSVRLGRDRNEPAVAWGLIGIRELQSGHIDHALALAIPHAATGVVVFPAQRSDGNDRAHGAIPEGTRFRLDPRLNIAALHLPPVVQALAKAAQRYGMIVRDQSGAVTLYAQDPTPLGRNPYYGPHGLFDGLSPAVLMRYFPWHSLQVVRPGKLGG